MGTEYTTFSYARAQGNVVDSKLLACEDGVSGTCAINKVDSRYLEVEGTL